MLNLKSIALEYGIEYGINKLPEVGTSNAYYEVRYNLSYPLIAIVSVVAFLVYYKKKKMSEEI